jgi:outer membrane protein
VNLRTQILPALAIGLASIAQAQNAATKVGVIQIQSAIIGTKDGQKAAKELEDRFAPKQKSLESKQNEIRQLQDQFQKGGNTMAEAAKNELARNIDTKTKAFNRDMEDARAEYEQEQQRVLADLGQKMMSIIDKYAKDNGFALILDVSNPQTPVLYASTTIDVTKDIIDAYDKSAPPTTSAAPSGGATAPAARPAPSKPSPTAPATKKQ